MKRVSNIPLIAEKFIEFLPRPQHKHPGVISPLFQSVKSFERTKP